MKRRHKPEYRKWTDFFECNEMRDASGERFAIPEGARIYRNNLYTVQVREMPAPAPFELVMWLSIKRNDRAPIHDWRDLQLIKNVLIGEQAEAVEIYPAEERLVDTSNQYHLWAFPRGFRLPFGFQERLVMDVDPTDRNPLTRAAVQRPWPKDRRPRDVMTAAQALAALGLNV